jgi:hypothetical protein
MAADAFGEFVDTGGYVRIVGFAYRNEG